MKLAFLVLGAAAVIASAGGFLMVKASHFAQNSQGYDIDRPLHLVTPQMEVETKAMGNRLETQTTAKSELGAPVTVAPQNAANPQFVLFIKDDCPCSIEAQPIFNDLSRKFKSKVDFVGVIDSDEPGAKKYASQFTAAFPIVADKGLKIIKKFEAKGGVYSALIARNGHLIKMWPGYSVDMLAEMNKSLSDSAGITPTRFDPEYAPKVKTAGCAYPW